MLFVTEGWGLIHVITTVTMKFPIVMVTFVNVPAGNNKRDTLKEKKNKWRHGRERDRTHESLKSKYGHWVRVICQHVSRIKFQPWIDSLRWSSPFLVQTQVSNLIYLRNKEFMVSHPPASLLPPRTRRGHERAKPPIRGNITPSSSLTGHHVNVTHEDDKLMLLPPQR